MGTVLGIAGFTLLWAATCLTEASLAEIVLTGLLGLALMIAGRLWTPCMGWIKERMRRQPMPAPAGSNSRPQVSGVRERQARGVTGEADAPYTTHGEPRAYEGGSYPGSMRDAPTAGARVDNAGSCPESRRDVLPAGPRRARRRCAGRRCAGEEGTPCGSGKRVNRPV